MSILGNGDIASVLPERDDLLFFASGVSNSQEMDPAAYRRELELLLEQPRDSHIVYFSSLSVLNGTGMYIDHKRRMERIVSEQKVFDTSTIVRLGNIAWGTNPHTFINYLREHPEAPVRDEYRYIVDREEFLYWINLIPAWSCEMNIPGRRMKVQEAIDEYGYTGLPIRKV